MSSHTDRPFCRTLDSCLSISPTSSPTIPIKSFPNSSPADYLRLFENAAAEVLAGLRARVQGETGEMEEPVPGEVQVLLTSDQHPVSMLSLVKLWGGGR